MKSTLSRLLFLSAIIAGGFHSSAAVVNYSLTTPRYFKDGTVQMSSPAFVDGVRGVFPEGSYSSYACNAQMPEGYYATSWQLDKAWGTAMSGTTILSWGAQDAVGFTFDPKWAEKYKTKALELTVRIDQKTYSVAYDANGGVWSDGEPSGPQGAKYWAVDLTAADGIVATRSGYTLAGWNTTKTGRGVAVALGGTLNGSVLKVKNNGDTVTLYAQWTPNRYPLTLKKGKGIEAVYYQVNGASAWTKTQAAQTEVAVDCDSTWYAYATAATGYAYDETSVSSPESGRMGTSGAAFECEGTPNAITVSYSGNGSTSGATGTSAFKYDEARTLTRNGFVRTYRVTFNANGGTVSPSSADASFSFSGWNDQKDGQGAYSYADEQRVTNPCGSTGGAVTLYATWDATAAAVRLPSPSRAGSEFLGWYTEQIGGTRVGSGGDDYLPDGVTTLYAHWKSNPYPLTLAKGAGIDAIYYKVNDATAWTMTRDAYTELAVDFDTTWYAYATAATGYTYTATSMSKPQSGKMGTAGAAFECAGTPNVITVSYGGNGSTSGSTSASTFKYDEAKTLAKNGFVRTYRVTYNANGGSVSPSSADAAYAFAGWNDRKDGTGAHAYADEQLVTNPCGSTGGAVSLYAQWDASSASVRLLLPIRSGFAFAGWYTQQSGGERVGGAGDDYCPTGDVTLFAQWRAQQYPLTLVKGAGIDAIYYKVNGATGWTATQAALTEVSVDFESTWYAYATAATGYTYDATSISKPQSGRMGTSGAAFECAGTPHAITVSYVGNGSTSGSTGASTFKYNEAKNLNRNGFVRAYRVTYNANGGTVSPSSADAAQPFAGWNDRADGTGAFTYADEQEVTNPCDATGGAVSLYAQWGAKSVALPQPENGEQRFGGWYTQQTGGERVGGAGDSYAPTEDVTLFARWVTPCVITVRVEPAEAGTATGGGAYGPGEVAVLDVIPAVGYSFSQWSDGDVSRPRRVTATADATYVAQMRVGRYVLNFDAQGGVLSESQRTKEITYGAPYGELPEPTAARAGEGFLGWFTEKAGGTKVTATDIVRNTAAEQWLYAQWGEKAYAIAYETSGGTIVGDYPTRYKPGETVTLPTDVEKPGFTFGGWYDNARFYDERIVQVGPDETGDKTFYAQWQTPPAATCSLGYAPGDWSEGAVCSNVHAQGTHVILEGALYHREGYAQWAWSRDRKGISKAAALGAELTLSKDETFYPCWSNNAYTIVFDGNGGTGDMAPLAARYDEPMMLSSNQYVRSNYAFCGWTTRPDAPAVFAEGETVSNLTPTADATVTLYAVWQESGVTPTVGYYTIHFAPNADVINPDAMTNWTVRSGEAVTLPDCAYTNLASGGWAGWVWDGQTNKYNVVVEHFAARDGEIVVIPAAWKRLSSESEWVGLTNADVVVTNTYDSALWQEANGGRTPDSKCAKLEGKDVTKDGVSSLRVTVCGPGTIAYWVKGDSSAITLLTVNCGTETNKPEMSSGAYSLNVVSVPLGVQSVSWDVERISDRGEDDAVYRLDDITWTPSYTNRYAIATSASPAAGGTTSGGGTYDVGTKATLKAVPKPGYTFVQWSDGSTNLEHEVSVWGDITNYVAQFKSNVKGYAIVYDGNGATDPLAMPVQACVCGAATALTANRFARPGYVFSHWLDSHTGETHANGASVTDLAAADGAILLRAVWTPASYAIAFAGNGGTGTMADLPCRYDAPAQLTANAFARTGHAFAGWATQGVDTVVFADRAIVRNLAAGGKVTLSAVWEAGEPPTPITVKVAGRVATKGYTGDEQSVSGYDLVASVPEGLDYQFCDIVLVGKAEARGTDMGHYPMGLGAESFSNRNERFAVTFDVTDGGLDITPVRILAEPGAGTVPSGGCSKFDAAGAYDGTVQAYDAAALTNAFAAAGYAVTNVAYAATAEGPWGDEPPAFVNAGATSFWYRVSAENYLPFVHEVRFVVAPRDIALCAVADIPPQVETGLPVEPPVTVTDGEPSVVAPADYDVAYENNVAPGEATVTLTGRRNYAGTKTASFTIVAKPKPPTPVIVTITGRAVTNVYDRTAHVAEGYAWTATDAAYTAADFDCTGSVRVSQTAVGTACAGLTPEAFTNLNAGFVAAFVVARDISATVLPGTIGEEPGTGAVPPGGRSKFDAATAYDGTVQTYDAAALTNAYADAGYAVTNVAYAATAAGPWGDAAPARVDAGTTSFWYRVSAENYESFVHEVRLTVTPRDMALVTVADIPPQVATGLPIEPPVTVTDGEPSVVTPADYDVAYENNVAPGEATVTLTGRRNYAGTKTAHFLISEKPLERVRVTIAGQAVTNVYNGAAHVAEGYAWTATDAAYTASDFVCTGTVRVSQTVVGTAYAGLTSAAFKNLNAGYAAEFVVVRDVSATILPGTIGEEPGTGTVPPGGRSKFDAATAYDGTAQAYDAAALTNAYADAGYAVTNVAYAATAAGPWGDAAPARVDAGTTSFWYCVSAENYEPFVHAAVWTVVPRDGVTVTVTGHAATNVYDGAVHAAAGYDVASDVPIYGEGDMVFTGTARAVRTEAGVTRFGLKPSDFANANANFTNVAFVVARDGEVVVTKAELSEEPGEGEVPPGGLSKFDVTAPYDRLAHTVNAAAIRTAARKACGADAVVTFGSTELGPWTATPASFWEVGTHVLWYRIVSGNYKTYVQAVRVTVVESMPFGEVGRYFGHTLDELGVDATDATGVKATGLPAGLAVKKSGLVGYYVEGVPTATASTNDGQCAYLRITRKVGKASVETLVALPIQVVAASVPAIDPPAVLNEAYEPTPVDELWPEVAEAVEEPKSWSFAGWPTGIKYTTRDVARQAEAYEVYGKATKAGVFTVTATRTVASAFTTAKLKEKYYATFMTEPAAGEGIAYAHRAYEAVSVDLAAAYPGLKSVAGLPTGLKYATKRIDTATVTAEAGEVYGKPTKVGAYAVTLTMEDRTKRQILWQIVPGVNAGATVDFGGSASVGGIVQVELGLPVAWALAAADGARVTVTGLPTGLAYKDGCIAGVPTKAGNYVATVKTVANGVTVTQTFAVTAKALPTYLVGTYYGAAANVAGTAEQMTLTLAATGKVTGGFYVEGKKVSFSAKSLDRRTPDGRYVATIAYTYGRLPYEDEIVLATTNAVDGVDLWFVMLGETDGVLESVDVRRDVIKDVYGKLAAGTYAIEDPTFSEGEYLMSKVAASGAVTVSGKLADANGKLVSVSCSTRLAVLDEERSGCWITVYKTVSRQSPITYVRYWELPARP